MSVYRCNACEGYFDCDWVGCEADPQNDCGLLCLDCYEEVKERKAMPKVTPKSFDEWYREQIRLEEEDDEEYDDSHYEIVYQY